MDRLNVVREILDTCARPRRGRERLDCGCWKAMASPALRSLALDRHANVRDLSGTSTRVTAASLL